MGGLAVVVFWAWVRRWDAECASVDAGVISEAGDGMVWAWDGGRLCKAFGAM